MHGQDFQKTKKADEQRIKSEEKYRTLFESIDEGFCLVRVLFDKSGYPNDYRFLEVNSAFKEYTGLMDAEGKKISEIVLNVDEFWIDRVGEVVLTGNPIRCEQFMDSLDRNFDIHAFPVGDYSDRIVGVLLKDTTQRKQTEKKFKKINETLEIRVEERTSELQSYQRQLRSLASELNKTEEQERLRIASELHNNLGQMLTVAKMKLNGLNKSEVPENTASELEDLSSVIDEALTFTRNLMTELKPPPVLDKEGIREILDWVAKEIEKYDLEVIIHDDHQPKSLDEEIRKVLYQCVRELLLNVVKFAGVNEVRLELSREDDNICVIVEDEGRGMDMKKINPISLEEEGFGLFNIQERMNWIGGNFEITSEPGKGTKATLCAPLKDNKQNTVSENGMEGKWKITDTIDDENDQETKLRILIADDHQMVRKGFKQMINKQDDLTVVGEASDGQEVVQLARQKIPDLILMDVNMPKMDGIEATKVISSEIPSVCIIGLSLHNSTEVVQNMLSAGASAYLSKDHPFESLCETIRTKARNKKTNGC